MIHAPCFVTMFVILAAFCAFGQLSKDTVVVSVDKVDKVDKDTAISSVNTKAVVGDTASSIVSDTSSKVNGDTSAVVVNDTSSIITSDTASTSVSDTTAVDTETVDVDALAVSHDLTDSVEGTELADFTRDPPPESRSLKDNRLIRYLLTKIFYIIFFAVCIAVIIATVIFFMTRRDTRRFLTTTRLSVLDKMVQRGCRYIETNYMNPELSVALVCRELVTGEAYLDTLFMREIGVGVGDFIAQVRVDRLKKLLRKGAEVGVLDIESVCKACGFVDRRSAEVIFAKINKGSGIEVFAETLKNT